MQYSVDYDAISAATRKAGNYGKFGGAFHSGITASVAADGIVEAIGTDAENEGVIWPVRVSDISVLDTLGGEQITDDNKVTVATYARGATSFSNLVGYETLTEAPAYSYYIMNGVPTSYMNISVSGSTPEFTVGTESAFSKSTEPTVAYGTNWGDVQLGISETDNADGKLVNAVVITADDGTKVGLVHLYNVWSFSDITWKAATVSGLDGKTITNILYYCSIKDDTVEAGNNDVPEYANYIYDYQVNLAIPPVYSGTVSASFDDSNSITVTGLPEDAQNLKAKVYYTEGRAQKYLTPLEVDPADGDIDPVYVSIADGKIAISGELVEVTSGDKVETYGNPEEGKTYTIEISCDNYIINKITAKYGSEENTYVLMNISYSEFYAAELGEGDAEVDAVTSATKNKPRTGTLAGGSYHVNSDGSDITGVIFPVSMTQSDFNTFKSGGYKEITESDSVDITVTNRGQTTTTTYSGKDALFESSSYSYYVISGDAPAYYKEAKYVNGELIFETA